ncbi:unnamed protein product [Closterium sp. NIES-54]
MLLRSPLSRPFSQVLCSAWKDDGTTVFSGGCDKQAKMWPLMSGGAASTVGVHDAPICKMAWIAEMSLLVTASWDKTIKCVRGLRWGLVIESTVGVHDAHISKMAWIAEMSLLLTASRDKTIKYWDTRQATPAHTPALPEQPYGLSVRHPLMVVATVDAYVPHTPLLPPPCPPLPSGETMEEACGCSRSTPSWWLVATADRHIIVYNLASPQVISQVISPLKYQTRCVPTFPDRSGYLVGSIEGRVAVQHVEENQQPLPFPPLPPPLPPSNASFPPLPLQEQHSLQHQPGPLILFVSLSLPTDPTSPPHTTRRSTSG